MKNKSISKITISNTEGTTLKEYDNATLAKVEIGAKYLKNSTQKKNALLTSALPLLQRNKLSFPLCGDTISSKLRKHTQQQSA